ncbi:MAG TPA: DUF5317 domain-containing protein [Clostridiales bacterium]|nr:DUF5317 domain-containing protein [Clostridiales bacterium]
MFYCTLAAAVITGLIRGGKLTNLTKVKLNHPWLVFLSALLDVGLLALIKNDFPVTRPMAFISLSLQYLLLFVFLWFNRRIAYSWVIALGCFLNGLVILINKGSMPLAEIGPYIGKSEFANSYLLNGKLLTYHTINENTLLWFLGDVIWIPAPFKIFISIGDLILYAGAFLLVQHLIAGKTKKTIE